MRGRVFGGTAVLAAGGVALLALHGIGPVQANVRIADLPAWIPAAVHEMAPPAAKAIPAAPAVRKGTVAAIPAPALVIGSYQQVLINRDRAGAHRGPLTWNGCLLAVAVANARRMAAQGYISHTNGAYADLGCRLGAQGGENVGWWSGGVNDAQLNSMFMASPDHRANIMGPYQYVATAWAVGANGYAYLAVEFA